MGTSKLSTPAPARTTGRNAASAERARTLACCTRATAPAMSKLDSSTDSTTSSSTGSLNARHHSRGAWLPAGVAAKLAGSSVTGASVSSGSAGRDANAQLPQRQAIRTGDSRLRRRKNIPIAGLPCLDDGNPRFTYTGHTEPPGSLHQSPGMTGSSISPRAGPSPGPKRQSGATAAAPIDVVRVEGRRRRPAPHGAMSRSRTRTSRRSARASSARALPSPWPRRISAAASINEAAANSRARTTAAGRDHRCPRSSARRTRRRRRASTEPPGCRNVTPPHRGPLNTARPRPGPRAPPAGPRAATT